MLSFVMVNSQRSIWSLVCFDTFKHVFVTSDSVRTRFRTSSLNVGKKPLPAELFSMREKHLPLLVIKGITFKNDKK